MANAVEALTSENIQLKQKITPFTYTSQESEKEQTNNDLKKETILHQLKQINEELFPNSHKAQNSSKLDSIIY